MTRKQLHAAIVQRAGCDVLDVTLRTLGEHERDVKRRLRLQRTARPASDVERAIIERNIDRLQRTLTAIREMQKAED